MLQGFGCHRRDIYRLYTTQQTTRARQHWRTFLLCWYYCQFGVCAAIHVRNTSTPVQHSSNQSFSRHSYSVCKMGGSMQYVDRARGSHDTSVLPFSFSGEVVAPHSVDHGVAEIKCRAQWRLPQSMLYQPSTIRTRSLCAQPCRSVNF